MTSDLEAIRMGKFSWKVTGIWSMVLKVTALYKIKLIIFVHTVQTQKKTLVIIDYVHTQNSETSRKYQQHKVSH